MFHRASAAVANLIPQMDDGPQTDADSCGPSFTWRESKPCKYSVTSNQLTRLTAGSFVMCELQLAILCGFPPDTGDSGLMKYLYLEAWGKFVGYVLEVVTVLHFVALDIDGIESSEILRIVIISD